MEEKKIASPDDIRIMWTSGIFVKRKQVNVQLGFYALEKPDTWSDLSPPPGKVSGCPP